MSAVKIPEDSSSDKLCDKNTLESSSESKSDEALPLELIAINNLASTKMIRNLKKAATICTKILAREKFLKASLDHGEPPIAWLLSEASDVKKDLLTLSLARRKVYIGFKNDSSDSMLSLRYSEKFLLKNSDKNSEKKLKKITKSYNELEAADQFLLHLYFLLLHQLKIIEAISLKNPAYLEDGKT